MAPIHFYIKPPFSELSPLSREIFGTPQVTQFLEGPTSPLFNKERGVELCMYGNFVIVCLCGVDIDYLHI